MSESQHQQTQKQKQGPAMALALFGLALVGAGLGLALLSNPARFSLSVADDRRILFLAISSLACVAGGLVLFLLAIRYTTREMPARFKARANAGVGLGVALQLTALFLPEIVPHANLYVLPLILCSLVAFLWAASNYAQGKGYSPWLGLLGIVGFAGLVVLILLPHRPSGGPSGSVADS